MVLWISYALASAFAAAFVAIFLKLSIAKIGPLLSAAMYATITSILLITACFVTRKLDGFSWGLLQSKEGVCVLLAGLAGSISWILYMTALQYGLVTQVFSVERTSILFVIILSTIILGETLTMRTTAGALLILIGAYLISTTTDVMVRQ